MFLDDIFTHSEAAAACKEQGTLAMAGDLETFRVLRGMLNNSRATPSDAMCVGAWLDGRLDGNLTWQCDSTTDYECPLSMPWTQEVRHRKDEQKCVLLHLRFADGVTNCFCANKMPAICEVK